MGIQSKRGKGKRMNDPKRKADCATSWARGQARKRVDGVEGVCPQVIHKRRFDLDVGFGNAQLLSDYFFNALFDIGHDETPLWLQKVRAF